MEIENSTNAGKTLSGSERKGDLIKVRAVISCPTCNYRRAFKNQYHRKQIELMVVSLKVFDWMVCNKCGELLHLNLEFKI